MDNIEEKRTKRKKLFLYLGMGLSIVGVVSTAVGVYCSGVRKAYESGYQSGSKEGYLKGKIKAGEDNSKELKSIINNQSESLAKSYNEGFNNGLEIGRKDILDQSSDAYKRGFSDGLNSSDSVTSKMLQDAYNEGEFHEKYRLLDELSTPDLSVPEQRYLAGCCDIKLVKMRDGEGEMMLSNHTNPRAENSIAMMKELRRNSL